MMNLDGPSKHCVGLNSPGNLIPGRVNTSVISVTAGSPWAMTKKHVLRTADRLIYIPSDRRDGSAVLDSTYSTPSLPRHAFFARNIVVTIRKRLTDLN